MIKEHAELISMILTIVVLAASSVEDLRHQSFRLWPYLAVGAALVLLRTIGGLWSGEILGALVPGAFFLMVYLFTRGRMGIGDALAVSLCGLGLGQEHIVKALFISFAAVFAAFGILMLRHRLSRQTTLPYLPFLLGGVLCSLAI